MKRGISIASLGIALIILSTITGIIVINSKAYLDEAKKSQFVTEYMLIKTAVEKYYDYNGSYPTQKQAGVDKSFNLVASSDADDMQFDDDFAQVVSGINLKIIDASLLGYDDLTIGVGKSETDYYGVSNDGELYYIKGVTYNDKVYYKVCDELK